MDVDVIYTRNLFNDKHQVNVIKTPAMRGNT